MRLKEILKYCIVLIINIIPFFLSCLLYEGGGMITMTFPIIQGFINYYNYKCTNKVISYLILNLAMLISSVKSISISTQLYYNNVSSDNDTLAVGDFEVKFAFAYILLITFISIICRIVNRIIQNKKQNG